MCVLGTKAKVINCEAGIGRCGADDVGQLSTWDRAWRHYKFRKQIKR